MSAAALKLADRTATALAAGTFGLGGRAARWIWLPLAALEAALAFGVLLGPPQAALLAAALLGAFALAQAAAIAAGRSGAPCGCFGARGSVSWGSVGRTRAARRGGGAARARLRADPSRRWRPRSRCRRWRASSCCVRGAPAARSRSPAKARRWARGSRSATASSLRCSPSAGLPPVPRPAAARASASAPPSSTRPPTRPRGRPRPCPARPSRSRWTPTAPCSRRERSTRAASSRRSCRRARARAASPPAAPARGAASCRPASAAVAVLTAGRMVGSLVAPGDADAHHMCGHTFTTDGCPHPTGLPRIDRHGYPLRAQRRQARRRPRPPRRRRRRARRRGRRAAARSRRPRAAARARARRVCNAAGKRYKITTRTDGSWYRCCDGHVRKLDGLLHAVGASASTATAALTGYCYNGRRVFCVMYFQSKVPC